MNGFSPKWLFLFLAMSLLQACGAGHTESSKKETSDNSNQEQTILDNGQWRDATPESVGLDASSLSQAFDYAMADGTFSQAALVIKDGKLIYERYRGIGDNESIAVTASFSSVSQIINSIYGTRDKNSLATSWSMAKSFTSVLIGIAVGQKYINSIDDKVSKYISEWAVGGYSNITIRNLLNMRSGLQHFCYDSDSTSLSYCEPDNDVSDNFIVLASNQVDTCLDRPLSSAAGSTNAVKNFVYANCDTMILGEILYQVTGQDLQNYADVNLFSKIDINAEWWRDSSQAQVGGNRLAYCCLDATPRDFAKFGQLILNNGLWDGKQIIPSGYIEDIKISAKTMVNFHNNYSIGYGLQFWSYVESNRPNSVIYYADGYDGQYIMIDFENNMVIVRNSLYQKLPINDNQKRMSIDIDMDAGFNLEAVNLLTTSAPFTLPMSAVQSDIKSNHEEWVFYNKIIQSIK